jgi:hypothetical protein
LQVSKDETQGALKSEDKLYKNITKEEFILLNITKYYKSQFRERYLKRAGIKNTSTLKDSLYKKGLLLFNGGITDKGRDLVNEINPSFVAPDFEYNKKYYVEILKKWD